MQLLQLLYVVAVVVGEGKWGGLAQGLAERLALGFEQREVGGSGVLAFAQLGDVLPDKFEELADVLFSCRPLQ